MQHRIALITLGVTDVARSRRFYAEGFGWEPEYENSQIAFYQANGLVFGIWLKASLENDMRRRADAGQGAYALAHNVPTRDDVDSLTARLVQAGGALLRTADEPPHGGYRSYIADPDGHAWEIAWNPAWPIDGKGRVTLSPG